MAIFIESLELKKMAKEIIKSQDIVSHINVEEILFLQEKETTPKAAARCYALKDKPIQFFIDKRFCIVFYESNIDYFTKDQRAILLFHELMHIPVLGDKLIDHDIKDFYEILQLGVDWNHKGVKVPKIIKGEDDEKSKKAKKVDK